MIPYDPKKLIELVGNDAELLKEVFEIFVNSHSEKIQSLRTALEKGETKQVADHAHHLKGDLLTLGYTPAIEVAQKIEELGLSGQTLGGAELLSSLEESIVPILDFYKNRKETL